MAASGNSISYSTGSRGRASVHGILFLLEQVLPILVNVNEKSAGTSLGSQKQVRRRSEASQM